MDNKIKLTEDEISEITKLNAEYQNVILSLGEIELKINQLKIELKEAKKDNKLGIKKYSNILSREKNFKDRLFEKYGDGEIDVQFGVYIKNNEDL
jgi:hypothetical protein